MILRILISRSERFCHAPFILPPRRPHPSLTSCKFPTSTSCFQLLFLVQCISVHIQVRFPSPAINVTSVLKCFSNKVLIHQSFPASGLGSVTGSWKTCNNNLDRCEENISLAIAGSNSTAYCVHCLYLGDRDNMGQHFTLNQRVSI